MNSAQIKFYDLLRKELNLSDDKAASFVGVVEEVVEYELKNNKQSLATKEDTHKIHEDIHKLELKIEQAKGDIYKAMFWTGIVQLLAILGGVLGIMKFMQE